jgi:hypothetical protein
MRNISFGVCYVVLLSFLVLVATQGLPVTDEKVNFLESLAKIDTEATQDRLIQKLLDDELYLSQNDFDRISVVFFKRQIVVSKYKITRLQKTIQG